MPRYDKQRADVRQGLMLYSNETMSRPNDKKAKASDLVRSSLTSSASFGFSEGNAMKEQYYYGETCCRIEKREAWSGGNCELLSSSALPRGTRRVHGRSPDEGWDELAASQQRALTKGPEAGAN